MFIDSFGVYQKIFVILQVPQKQVCGFYEGLYALCQEHNEF